LRAPTLHERLAGDFEDSDGLRARHGWEGVEELIEAVARLKVIEQVLDGHARAHEDRHAAHDFGVAVNDQISRCHRRSDLTDAYIIQYMGRAGVPMKAMSVRP